MGGEARVVGSCYVGTVMVWGPPVVNAVSQGCCCLPELIRVCRETWRISPSLRASRVEGVLQMMESAERAVAGKEITQGDMDQLVEIAASRVGLLVEELEELRVWLPQVAEGMERAGWLMPQVGIRSFLNRVEVGR